MRKKVIRLRFLRIACAIALLACFIVGCGGDEFNRVPVSGTVTLDGTAVASGSILAWAADVGTEAPNVGAPITDGKFSFSPDQAPVAGSYIFEIGVAAAVEETSGGGEPDPEQAGETGPEVTYRKTIDIPEGGSESLSIELTSADKVAEE